MGINITFFNNRNSINIYNDNNSNNDNNNCPRSKLKRARRYLGSPARKRCWNIFAAFRIFFSQEKEKQEKLWNFKSLRIIFDTEKT